MNVVCGAALVRNGPGGKVSRRYFGYRVRVRRSEVPARAIRVLAS
ncbi:MAG: hypothetical protein ACRDQX_14325 [Pseudonocardiaceae bacterium]